MHTSVSEVECLAGMNSCRIWSLYCFGFDFSRWEGWGEGWGRRGLQKSHCLVATIRFFSQIDFCGYCYCAHLYI